MEMLLRVAAMWSVIGLIAWLWLRIIRSCGILVDDASAAAKTQLQRMTWVCLVLALIAGLCGSSTTVHFPATPTLHEAAAHRRWLRRAGIVLIYQASLMVMATAAILAAHFSNYSQILGVDLIRFFALSVSEASITIACVQLIPGPGSILSFFLPQHWFRAISYKAYFVWFIFATLIGLFGGVQQALLDVVGESLYSGLMQLLEL